MQNKNFGLLKINIVLYLHVLWVGFIYLGWFFILFYPKYNMYFYFPVLFLTLLSRSIFKGDCILTNIENDLRKKYLPSTVYNNTDKCLPFYSEKWFGFRVPKKVIGIVFGFCFVSSLFFIFEQLYFK